MKQPNTMRIFAAYLVGFFLIVTVLTAFIVLPQMNEVAQRQYDRDSTTTLQIEGELLRRHVNNQVQILKDLASLPAVANAVLLSSQDNQNFLDAMDNFTIGGKETPLVLQNIIGGVIYRSNSVSQGVIGTLNPIFGRLMEGRLPFGFELLPSKVGVLNYKLSVPVVYQSSVEGMLSAEIKINIDNIFSPQLIEDKFAFIIKQGSLQVETSTDQVLRPEAFSQNLPDLNIELIYLHDQSNLLADQNKLRNTILLVLLTAMALSFAAFMILGYRSLTAQEGGGVVYKRETLVIPIGMGGLGLAVAIVASVFTYQNQVNNASEDIINRHSEQLRTIEARLVRKINLMKMLTGLFEASDHVTKDEFEKFTLRVLEGHRDIHTLIWAPYVADEARNLFESHGRAQSFDMFEVRDVGENGNLIRASKREWYLPSFYVAPGKESVRIIGFDLASEAKRKRAILLAREKNTLVTTGLLNPINDPKGKPKIIIYSPVMRDTPRKKMHFVGVISGAFLIKDIVSTVQAAGTDKTYIKIEDVTETESPKCVLCDDEEYNADPAYSASRIISIGGRQWKLSAFPKTPTLHTAEITIPFVILLTGIFMSFFVSYTFWQLVRRRQIVEAQVETRTQEVRELSEAMEKTVEGVSRIDPNGRYTYLNEAYAATCGYSPDELTGKNWTETVHAEDHEMMNQEYQIMLDAGYVSAEPRGLRKDGTIFYKKVTMMSRFDEDGKFIGHHCFMSDITKRKEAEIELLRSNSDLDDFAYIASHDLKEPLRGIHNHAKLYVEDNADQLDEESAHRMSRIIYLSQRMEKLINDLLYYSRLGRQAAEFEAVDLNEVVIQEQGLLSDEQNVAITLKDKLPTIRCDKLRAAELFRNLIANGIKYNDSELKKIAIGLKFDQSKARGNVPIFYVKDNGIGIDARFHKDIFKIFKRLHKKDAYGGGSGSGLTFVKKIVSQHKGDIWLESEPGKGSTFYFTLGKSSGVVKEHITEPNN